MKPTIDEIMAGGNGTPPTPTPPVPPVPPITDIKPGTGEPTPADLEAERQRQAAAAAKPTEPVKPAAGTKTAEEIAAEHVAAGRNPDGTEKTSEQKAEDDRLRKEEEQMMQEDAAVWKEVNGLWGRELEVEYKNANNEDVDPNTPEGIFLREQAVAARAVNEFELELERRLPRAYAFVLHSQAGLPEEDFWQTKTVTLPAFDELQNSVDLQVKVYTDSLRVKGLDETEIKALVDIATRDKKLTTLATNAYKATEKAQQEEIDRLSEVNLANQKAYDRSIQVLSRTLDEEMATGMKIMIPDAKKAEFSQFVRSRIILQEGGFFVAQPIETKNVGALLDQLYFAYSKGNLGDLIQRSATTQNTVRLRARHNQSASTPTSKPEERRQKMTLGEI